MLSIYLTAACSLLAFGLALRFAGLPHSFGGMVGALSAAVGTVKDPELSDAEKGRGVRRSALLLIGHTLLLGLRFAAILASAAAPLALAELAGLAQWRAVLDWMLTWEFLLGTTAAAMALLWLWRRRSGAGSAEEAGAPMAAGTFADRIFHDLAFFGPGVQLAAARWERRRYKAVRQAAEQGAPVWIAGLPRSGTTTLLQALAAQPQFAAQTYRDMPLPLAPLLARGLGRAAKRSAATAERAHGDGIQIGLDSPEAFEEVLWMALEPGMYSAQGIACWTDGQPDSPARAFLGEHMRSVVAAAGRAGEEPPQEPLRYLAKNNADIARLPALRAWFPQAVLLVPYRHPLDQARSLSRQHHNFLRQHGEDDFRRRYMRDLGHLEFGQLHRPILFPGMDLAGLDPEDGLDYWLAYWTAAYRHVRSLGGAVLPLCLEDLCDAKSREQARLAEALGLPAAARQAVAAHFRMPREAARPLQKGEKAGAELLEQAQALYDELRDA